MNENDVGNTKIFHEESRRIDWIHSEQNRTRVEPNTTDFYKFWVYNDIFVFENLILNFDKRFMENQ